jgi:hypothetical protein
MPRKSKKMAIFFNALNTEERKKEREERRRKFRR